MTSLGLLGAQRSTNVVPVDEYTDISGCALLAQAESVVADGLIQGSAVTTWRDESGNGRDHSQPSAPAKPTLDMALLNGKPAIVFNGSTTFLSAVTDLGLSGTDVPWSMLVAGSKVDGGLLFNVPYLLAGSGVPVMGCRVHPASGASLGLLKVDDVGTLAAPELGTSASVSRFLFIAICFGTTADMWFYPGGTTVKGVSFDVGVTTLTTSGIGGGVYPNHFWNGSLGVIAMYNRALTNLERRRLVAKAARHYAIAEF